VRQYQYRVERHLERPKVDPERRGRRRLLVAVLLVFAIAFVVVAVVDPLGKPSREHRHVPRHREGMEKTYRRRPAVEARVPRHVSRALYRVPRVVGRDDAQGRGHGRRPRPRPRRRRHRCGPPAPRRGRRRRPQDRGRLEVATRPDVVVVVCLNLPPKRTSGRRDVRRDTTAATMSAAATTATNTSSSN